MIKDLEQTETSVKNSKDLKLEIGGSSYSSSSGSSSISKTEIDAFFEHYKDKFEKQDSKIENQKLTIIETLGIFVALFTFISIDFQVFRSYRNPYAVGGLSLMLLGAISFLLVIFDFYILQARAIKNDSNNKYKNDGFFSSIKERYKNNPVGIITRIMLFICSLIFIVVGLLLFCNSHVEKFEDEKDQVKNEILDSIRLELKNQNLSSENINKNNSETIKNIDTNIANIKKCIKNFGFTNKCFE